MADADVKIVALRVYDTVVKGQRKWCAVFMHNEHSNTVFAGACKVGPREVDYSVKDMLLRYDGQMYGSKRALKQAAAKFLSPLTADEGYHLVTLTSFGADTAFLHELENDRVMDTFALAAPASLTSMCRVAGIDSFIPGGFGSAVVEKKSPETMKVITQKHGRNPHVVNFMCMAPAYRLLLAKP